VIRFTLGSIATVFGGIGFIAAIVFLRAQPELDELWPIMFALFLVGNLVPSLGAVLAVSLVARSVEPIPVLLVIVAPVVCYLTTQVALTLPEWSTIDWLLDCDGPCPAPPGQNEIIAAWIVGSLIYLAFAIAWSRNLRTVLLLVLAAIPLANAAVFVATRATPSTPPSTTAPRSPATADREA
jgi:hypothetical protein